MNIPSDGPHPPRIFRAADEAEDDKEHMPAGIDEVDLQALAEEIYALLKKELRLERERRGWHEMW